MLEPQPDTTPSGTTVSHPVSLEPRQQEDPPTPTGPPSKGNEDPPTPTGPPGSKGNSSDETVARVAYQIYTNREKANAGSVDPEKGDWETAVQIVNELQSTSTF